MTLASHDLHSEVIKFLLWYNYQTRSEGIVYMRLSESEVSIIKKVITKHIPDAKIMLFGSRVYDDKRGGDIDIFVQTNQNITLKNQLEILTQIELCGVERKVDLVLKAPNTKEKSIFATIFKEGIVL